MRTKREILKTVEDLNRETVRRMNTNQPGEARRFNEAAQVLLWVADSISEHPIDYFFNNPIKTK